MQQAEGNGLLDTRICWPNVELANKANMATADSLPRSANPARRRKSRTRAVEGGDELSVLANQIEPPVVVGEKARALVRSVFQVVSPEDAISVLREVTEANAAAQWALQVLELQGDQAKPSIQTRSGPFITTAEAAARLECSMQHVRDRIGRNELVGYPALGDRTRTVLPLWQFSGPKTVQPWVEKLIRAYGDNGWALLHFVTAPRGDLGGDTYLHWLQTQRVEETLTAIRRSNPD